MDEEMNSNKNSIEADTVRDDKKTKKKKETIVMSNETALMSQDGEEGVQVKQENDTIKGERSLFSRVWGSAATSDVDESEDTETANITNIQNDTADDDIVKGER
eukprot:7805962-Ditylum_brightwellii.AAC.1